MTVDTLSGAAGDPIRIRAGYLATEGAITIADGRLLYNGSIATFTVGERLTQPGPLHGAWLSQDLVLTSDFFFATGRLAGGNFRWEIASVAVLSGTAGTVGWGEFDHDGVFAGLASSAASSRIGRSYDTLAGYHEHEQAAFFTAAGRYDVTLIAWDSNGRFADSAPVTIRFEVLPAQPAADLNGDGQVDGIDLGILLAAWSSAGPGDLNGDGVVDGVDLGVLLGAWTA
jgi:hypothetical protein